MFPPESLCRGNISLLISFAAAIDQMNLVADLAEIDAVAWSDMQSKL